MENSIEVPFTTTSPSLNQLGVRNPPAASNNMKFDCEKSVNIICEKTVRYSFVSHLSAALSREGISVSVNDEDFQNQTVNDWATVSVVVISDLEKPWFAKLTKVTERMDNNGHLVVSVIYGVDPLNRGFHLVREFLKARNIKAHRSRLVTIISNYKLVDFLISDEMLIILVLKIYVGNFIIWFTLLNKNTFNIRIMD